MLRWPAKATQAIVALFRPLQDLEVYVEDTGAEALYSELFRKAAPPGLRVIRVFALNGRHNVIAAARSHDFAARPAMFMIDGDFEWVRGEGLPDAPSIYRLDAYCIENLLVCEVAATQVLMECEACSHSEATTKLDFPSWVSQVRPLVDLFTAWAVLNKVDDTVPTTSAGVGSVLVSSKSTSLSAAKVEVLLQDAIRALEQHKEGKNLHQDLIQRISTIAQPLDIVSGKDFLIPLLDLHMRAQTKERCSRKALLFRLARHVDAKRLVGLGRALTEAAAGRALS